MPYSLRFMARETLVALRVRDASLFRLYRYWYDSFRKDSQTLHWSNMLVVLQGSFTIASSIPPSCKCPPNRSICILSNCISTPETFDIVSSTVEIAPRRNLAQISRVLTQISSGKLFNDDNPCYIPINDFVGKAVTQMTTWLLEGTFG